MKKVIISLVAVAALSTGVFGEDISIQEKRNKDEVAFINGLDAHEFALSAIAKLKYNKSEDMLSEEERKNILSTDYEFKFLRAFYNLGDNARLFIRTNVAIASVAFPKEDITVEHFKYLAAASKCSVLMYKVTKQLNVENFSELLSLFKKHFKNEQFTEEKGAEFVEKYLKTVGAK